VLLLPQLEASVIAVLAIGIDKEASRQRLRACTGFQSPFELATVRLRHMSEVLTPPSVRKRTSTPLHSLAPETPTAKTKARCHTGHGDVRP
jgi:hypothetical protein